MYSTLYKTPVPKHFRERLLPCFGLLTIIILSTSKCSLKGKLGLHQRSIKSTTLTTRSCLFCFHSDVQSHFGFGCHYMWLCHFVKNQVFAGFCALSGVFCLTLPIPIIVNSFAGFYKNRLWRNEVWIPSNKNWCNVLIIYWLIPPSWPGDPQEEGEVVGGEGGDQEEDGREGGGGGRGKAGRPLIYFIKNKNVQNAS